MPDVPRTAPLALVALLAACSTTNTTIAPPGALPEVGQEVKLHLVGSTHAAYGVVEEVDPRSITLAIGEDGRLVARWPGVAAWEFGPRVSAERALFERVQAEIRDPAFLERALAGPGGDAVLELLGDLPMPPGAED